MRLLVNPGAGTADDERFAAAAEILGVTAEQPGDIGEFEAAVIDAAGGHVVIAGGDGSIHLAVRALHRAGGDALISTTFGLIPLGTGNDLATGLGLPEEPAAAAAVCRDGSVRTLDLIACDHDEVVVNASHAGLGAAAAEHAEGMKAVLGPFAYPLGALVAGAIRTPYDLEVTLDGQRVHTGPTLMVGIANGPTIGGGTRLVPGAVPDDGLLDLIVVSASGPAARLAFGVALRREAHIDREDVLWRRGRGVTITGDPVAHDIDGELFDEWTACRYDVVPAAWRLRVPA